MGTLVPTIMSWIEELQATYWHQMFWVSLSAYVLGCFATGYYVVRLRTGSDIREIGSCSVGATNVGRVLGKSGFMLTALGDFGKGALAVWGTRRFAPGDRMTALTMLAVIVGHVWPMQLWFRGGKGIATLLGALLVYDYRQALVFTVVFACAFLILRKTVLPGLLGVLCLPLVHYCFKRDSAGTFIVSLSVALVLFAHRRNILEQFMHLARHRGAHTQTDHL